MRQAGVRRETGDELMDLEFWSIQFNSTARTPLPPLEKSSLEKGYGYT